ncbi:nascent polypeptide-associated complex subunit alpha, muscle-specific form-like [Sorghum bicolor]|uniref:nascent polypeptide-associated complex subunit alpha, muscle-specific form-like n=1 Tax=Sorghum bicolor TaxID=4558 RepID=UPI000B426B56|nr:nascent polypeptide-associated complex subunit alpha, muscle-specific form-like [Sorghum bicolor]|eukprot:XP_021319185.1 nascent polypeptide-associated complex subunit alpha, muscle-specific form-like [Sorghum bicolor]
MSRQRGEPEEESPSEDDGGAGDDDSDDSEGMASRLDQILEGSSRGDVDTPRTGAPKEGPGGSHRPRADTPPAPTPSQVAPRPQPPPSPKAGGQAKPQATGPLTCGRAAASEKGETGRRSASLVARRAGDAGPRPTPAREGPGALTRGSSRPAARGTGRRAVLPVGLKRTIEQAQPSMAKRLKVGAAPKDSGPSGLRPSTGIEVAPPHPSVVESTPPSPRQAEAPCLEEQEGAPEPPRSGVEAEPITISDGSGGDGPSMDARPMDEEVEASATARRTP